MSTANRVLKNTLILYAKTGVTMFLSLYTTRVVLRELGADGFGVFVLIGGIIAMFGFLNGSMAAATQRFMSYAHGKEDDHEQQDIFSISLVLHSAVAVIAVLLLLSIGPLLFAHVLKIDAAHLETARILYNVVALSVIFPVLAVPYQAVIIARENMLMLALVGFLESLLKFGVAIYITHASGDKLLIYGILMAAIPAILLLTQGLVCHARYTECRFGLTGIRNRRLTREMLSFGGWSFLGSATSFLTQNGRGIVLNSFFGTTVNTAQGISNQISGQLSVLAQSLDRALNPAIVKCEGAGQRDRMLRLVMTGTKLTFSLKAVVIIPVIIEMPLLFSIWLVDVPEYAIAFTRIYLIQNLIETYSVGLSVALTAVGKIKGYSIVSSAVYSLALPLSIVAFLIGFEPESIYLIFVANALLLCGVQIYYGHKFCHLNPMKYLMNVPLRTGAAFVASVLFGFLIPTLNFRPIINSGLVVIASTSVFLLIFSCLVLDSNERQIIKSALLAGKGRLLSVFKS